MLRRLAALISAVSLLAVGAVGGMFVDRVWLARDGDADGVSLHQSLINALHGNGDRMPEPGYAATGESDAAGTSDSSDMSDNGGSTVSLLAQLHKELIGRLRDAVDLDPEQVAAIDSLVLEQQAGVDETWHMLHHRLQAAMDSVHREIMGLLRPEQREAFRRWIQNPDGADATGPPHGPGG